MSIRATVVAAGLVALNACVIGPSEEEDSCFAGNTMIATPHGPRAIRDLAIGDEVWSYDHVEHRFAIGKVTAIHRSRGTIRSLRTARGVLAAVTESHPIYVAARGEFVASRSIAVGERLLHWSGDPDARPEATEVLGLASPAPGDEVEVFNLTVGEAFSTFFADGFYVHNKSPEPAPCPAGARVTMTAPAHPFCVGARGDVKLHNSNLRCLTEEDLPKVVLATSDPTVLVVEARQVRGVAPGTATINAVFEGQIAGSAQVEVIACAIDAGADAAVTDSAASDSAIADGDAAGD